MGGHTDYAPSGLGIHHYGTRTNSTLTRGKSPINPKIDLSSTSTSRKDPCSTTRMSYIYVIQGDIDLEVFLSTWAVSVSGLDRESVCGPCFCCHIVIGRRRSKWNRSSGFFSCGDKVPLSLFQLKCHCYFSLFSQDSFSTVIILIVLLWVPPNPSSQNSGSHD